MMNFTICADVTVSVCSKAGCDYFKALNGVNHLAILDYDTDEYRILSHDLSTLLNHYMMFHGGEADGYDFDSLYWEWVSIGDKKYYDYAIDDFLEYESHMNEPNFDWGFYSDWHKDIYGYRPR